MIVALWVPAWFGFRTGTAVFVAIAVLVPLLWAATPDVGDSRTLPRSVTVTASIVAAGGVGAILHLTAKELMPSVFAVFVNWYPTSNDNVRRCAGDRVVLARA